MGLSVRFAGSISSRSGVHHCVSWHKVCSVMICACRACLRLNRHHWRIVLETFSSFFDCPPCEMLQRPKCDPLKNNRLSSKLNQGSGLSKSLPQKWLNLYASWWTHRRFQSLWLNLRAGKRGVECCPTTTRATKVTREGTSVNLSRSTLKTGPIRIRVGCVEFVIEP